MSLHVVMTTPGYLPTSMGGIETYVLNLAKFLSHQGIRVSILSPTVEQHDRHTQYEGLDVYAFKMPLEPNVREMNGLDDPHNSEAFSEILSELKPDVLHVHSLSRSVNVFHLRKANQLGIRTIFTSHLAGDICAKGDFFRKNRKTCNGEISPTKCMSCLLSTGGVPQPIDDILGIALSLVSKSTASHRWPQLQIIQHRLNQLNDLNEYCDEVVVLNDWSASIYRKCGVHNPVCISGGVDKEIFYASNAERIDELRLLFVGRMYPIKGVELLVDALSEFSEDEVNLTIVTVPDEGNMDYYHRVKEKFSAGGFTEWYESLSPERVSRKMDEAHILCLPSVTEVSPMVIQEAFAKKLPVLATRIPPLKMQICDGVDGLLFDVNSKTDLIEKIRKLIVDKSLVKKLSAGIQSPNSFEEVGRKYVELYAR